MIAVIGCLVVLQKDLTTNRFSSLWRLEEDLPSVSTPVGVMPLPSAPGAVLGKGPSENLTSSLDLRSSITAYAVWLCADRDRSSSSGAPTGC